jgi:acyl carrier protein phosphodiesterase
MNYLAHAWVSKSYDPFMLGQLLGDFAIRSEMTSTHEDLRRGADAHRALDAYTDAHPAFREGCRLLAPYCHRYAPVVMDVLIDHVLVTHWAELNASANGIEGFFEQVYETIDQHAWNLPERMRTPGSSECCITDGFRA